MNDDFDKITLTGIEHHINKIAAIRIVEHNTNMALVAARLRIIGRFRIYSCS